ncbi:SDR family oxidoreductase [Breznakiella homolactica]|uniref:SDR family oxidoreductase n=1 Tax=Breznakiella homolactica TaxID=2798577 RepID=A0A7T7XQG6_9SPIR|nr:SDR family oxidoreductase [Breznakiella homolactica]QQO10598.1 SDR family oxidoreductase [Breznakiella homolactica]
MKNIKDALVVITGGASGIGRLVGFSLAERGARVIAWDINPQSLKALEDEARSRGLAITGMACDVSDRKSVYAAADTVLRESGPVDILINNAGVVSGSTFLETPDEKIIKTMEVNVSPLFWTCKAFLPGMIERNRGHIVTISSAAGIIGVRGLADYSASKFAAFGFHESVRMELRRMKKKISSTVVCPFYIDTGMFKGVKSKVPLLLPILKSEYAARRIVSAILKNKKRLIMPRFVYGVYVLRLLPAGAFDVMADFFGINNSMDDFTGRDGKTNGENNEQ